MRSIAPLPLLVLSATVATADTLISMRVGGDDVSMPTRGGPTSGCERCIGAARPGAIVSIYVAPDRVRRDRGGQSVILLADPGRLLFICHATKEWSETPYPVEAGSRKRGERSPFGDLTRFELAGAATTEAGRVGEWPVETYAATVVNGLGVRLRLAISVTRDTPAADAPVLRLFRALREVAGGESAWTRFLPFERGIPVLWEEAQRQPETEFVYREEVVAIEDVDPPSGAYEVPPGYKRVQFDPAGWQTR